MENRNQKTSRLVFSAIMIAVGTVLSLLKIDFVMGGGLTICAMLPLVMVSFRYGTKWGVFTAYIVAYTVIGFSGIFRKKAKSFNIAVISGIAFTFFARFLCHFATGWAIWDALWPNEFGMMAPVYSLCYNGSYMLAEAVISSVAAIILFKKKPAFFQ